MTAQAKPRKSAPKGRQKATACRSVVPQDVHEAAHFLAEIGRHERHIKASERLLNDRLTLARQEHDEAARPHQEAIESLFEGLRIWAEANRQRLCADGGKTARLATGCVRWRMTPPKVKLTRVVDVLRALDAAGLDRFIAVKKDVNKQAILDDPAAVADIPGIEISQHEEFIAEPDEDEIAVPKTKAQSEGVSP